MGCDIHPILEVRHSDGKWHKVESYDIPGFNFYEDWDTEKQYSNFPLNWRSYGMFGFLADVRNYSQVPPLSEPRGLPSNSVWLDQVTEETKGCSVEESNRQYVLEGGCHSHSWLTLQELLDFNYDRMFEDRRVTKQADPGEGNMITFREFLGPTFFEHLEAMKTYGTPEDVRLVFWFDS